MQLVYAIIAVVVATVVASVVTNKVTISKLKNDAESKLGNAEAKARAIIDDAIKTAEATKKESLLEVKEESIKTKNELERETKERRAELQRYEKRVLSKEEALNSMMKRYHNGAIYLIHPNNKGNYEALETFIVEMKKLGYKFDLVKNID